MRRLLVTGGSGDLGRVVSTRAAATWETYTTYFTNPAIGGGQPAQVDLRDRTAVVRQFQEIGPDVIIHCAASDRSEDMEATNRSTATHVAEGAERVGARLIAISTDMIFDGRNPPYREDSRPTPLSSYGRVKAENEARVLETHSNSLIVRTSLIFDFNASNRQTSWMLSRITQGQPITLFVDEIRQPIWAWNLADVLLELAEHPALGILQVAGPKPVSRYDYGCMLLRALGYQPEGHVVKEAAASIMPDRPRDLTMDLSRAMAILSTPLLSLDEALESAQ